MSRLTTSTVSATADLVFWLLEDMHAEADLEVRQATGRTGNLLELLLAGGIEGVVDGGHAVPGDDARDGARDRLYRVLERLLLAACRTLIRFSLPPPGVPHSLLLLSPAKIVCSGGGAGHDCLASDAQ